MFVPIWSKSSTGFGKSELLCYFKLTIFSMKLNIICSERFEIPTFWTRRYIVLFIHIFCCLSLIQEIHGSEILKPRYLFIHPYIYSTALVWSKESRVQKLEAAIIFYSSIYSPVSVFQRDPRFRNTETGIPFYSFIYSAVLICSKRSRVQKFWNRYNIYYSSTCFSVLVWPNRSRVQKFWSRYNFLFIHILCALSLFNTSRVDLPIPFYPPFHWGFCAQWSSLIQIFNTIKPLNQYVCSLYIFLWLRCWFWGKHDDRTENSLFYVGYNVLLQNENPIFLTNNFILFCTHAYIVFKNNDTIWLFNWKDRFLSCSVNIVSWKWYDHSAEEIRKFRILCQKNIKLLNLWILIFVSWACYIWTGQYLGRISEGYFAEESPRKF